METMEKQEGYTSEWFRERALKCFKKIGDHAWDYSDSLLLYLPGTESGYEGIQTGEDPRQQI